MLKWWLLFLIMVFASPHFANAKSIPANFVYLKQIDPSIIQEIRYASSNNFIGRPIKGYTTAQCILTRPTAMALARVQRALRPLHLSLIVYDCYRPQMAVDDFMQWCRRSELQEMKGEFYPRVNKSEFFKLGYVAQQSGHTRGSTVDVSLIPQSPDSSVQVQNQISSCFAPYHQRFFDGSIDMGTNFDCMDELSNINAANINQQAYRNRRLLRAKMAQYGFIPYAQEWWHFTLKNEPFPNSYFNFAVK